MNSQSIFALPTSTASSTLNTLRSRSKTAGKRKRNTQHEQQDSAPQTDDIHSLDDDDDHMRSSEYTAVVTPVERSQRRLAGLSLDQSPPHLPFPHAPLPSKISAISTDLNDRSVRKDVPKFQSKPYLRSQHLSAMVAVLHRSMINRDFVRAGRALGLILRSDFAGRPIDIRSIGLWGIGAEILLYEKNTTSKTGYNHIHQSTISRGGFEHTKLYYERLMVQYPPHKTWPDVINTLDFCVAMFGLWVHVTNLEALQLYDLASSSRDEEDGEGSELSLYEVKNWEMNQAKQIAEAMDQRMQDITFAGFTEMMRLRGMVALWVADLIEACVELELEEHNAQHAYEQEQDLLSANVEHMVIDTPQKALLPQTKLDEASEHRIRARTLFSKLNDVDTGEGNG